MHMPRISLTLNPGYAPSHAPPAPLAVSRDGMVELFGHIRMIYEREKARLALEAGFPRFVKQFRGDADRFVSDILEPMADAFLLLSDDKVFEKQFGSEAAKAVRSLARIDNKDWVPPALLRLWNRKPGENEEVADFLIQLERLAYFLFVSRRGVNERIARFAAVMDEFEPRGGAQAKGLSLTEIEQAEFISELDGPIYLRGRVCKPLLQRLDEALSSGGASYDQVVSIEHVLPQTVDEQSEWATLFPDEFERNEWTHRLANLVFLTRRINTRASNWDFEKKKTEYFSSRDGSSPFVITQDVLRTERWTPEHLIVRQSRVLQKLATVWRLDLTKVQLRGRQFSEDGLEMAPGETTDSKAIEAKREAIMKALSRRENVNIIKAGGALYSSEDGDLRAVVTVSKRHTARAPYWYGYSPHWDTFLSGGKNSFLVLGCLDRNAAYAIPHKRIGEILGELRRTSERHWHIDLEDNEGGGLDLSLSKTATRMPLSPFELDLKHA
jgi:uncharacterized protein DUF1524